jgi:predicted nucleic acid-binding protein
VSLVVTDSGPLHYLILCRAIEVVSKLYGQLVIPAAVEQELTRTKTPPAVSEWLKALPQWASIHEPAKTYPSVRLGMGERQAIALALELKAKQLLIDDRAARRVAGQM